MQILFDKRVAEDALGPMRAAHQKAVHRFADLAGTDEQTAKPKVRALLMQSSTLRHAGWGETDLSRAATDALLHFYLEGRTEDVLLLETQRAWDSVESASRNPFLKRRRQAAQERYRSSWAPWGAARQS